MATTEPGSVESGASGPMATAGRQSEEGRAGRELGTRKVGEHS